jgi:hypothetical protein
MGFALRDFANLRAPGIRSAVRAATALALLAACGTARSEPVADYEVTTGLICDTPQQVERFIALFDGQDAGKAVKVVNSEAHNPSACAIASLAFIRGKNVETISRRDNAYTIVHILVFGIATEDGIRPIQPAVYFTTFAVREFGI